MIYTIIKNTITNLHKELTVSLQVDNGDGTYTLTLSSVFLIRINGYILGSNLTKYKVNSILGNDIIIEKTDTDVLTTIQCLQPYFYAGQYQDYSNHLDIENYAIAENEERFPSVFLITEFEENKYPDYEPTTISVVFTDYTTEITNQDRNDNEFPYLILLKNEFLKALEKNEYVVRITDDTFRKVYNAEMDTNNNTNRIDISLDITHLQNVNGC